MNKSTAPAKALAPVSIALPALFVITQVMKPAPAAVNRAASTIIANQSGRSWDMWASLRMAAGGVAGTLGQGAAVLPRPDGASR
jgi:hypothetical protein